MLYKTQPKHNVLNQIYLKSIQLLKGFDWLFFMYTVNNNNNNNNNNNICFSIDVGVSRSLIVSQILISNYLNLRNQRWKTRI